MAGKVQFRNDDLFDVECDLLILPCSTTGTVTRPVEQRLREHKIPLPERMEWGEVRLVRHGGDEYERVAYAAAVSGNRSSDTILRKIGGAIAELARSLPDRVERIAVPLLGSGAGGVPYLTAAQALASGFTEGDSDAKLVISVFDPDIYEQLVSDDAVEQLTANVHTDRRETPARSHSRPRRTPSAPELAQEETAPPAERPRDHVFISYSHKDREWLEQLRPHLKPLEREGTLIWDDTRMKPGVPWQKEIEHALASTKVAILLVSADFLASDFIIKNELPPLLHAAQRNGAIILSIILRPCGFVRNKSLAQFQAVNDPSTPLVQMRSAGRERIFDKVAQEVERALAA